MTKKLTKLRIDEISAVDSGAGRGVAVVLMKRATPAGYRWGPAFNLERVTTTKQLTDVEQQAASVAAAMQEIENNRAIGKAGPSLEDNHMPQTEIEVAKAAVDSRLDAIIAKSDKPISRDVALLRLAQSRDPRDLEAWQLHKALASTVPTPVTEPVAIAVSPAFEKMTRKARKLAGREGIGEAAAFAKVYQARPDLAQEDAAFHFAKATGDGVGPSPHEVLVRTIMSSYGLSREKAEEWAAQVERHQPAAAMLGGRQTIA